MAFTQVSVTGNFQLADGSAVDGSVTFTPTMVMRNSDATTETTEPAPVVAAIVGGTMTASLAATDDADTTLTGVTYKVEVRSHRHSGVLDTFWIEVPAGGGTIDLDTVERQFVAPTAAPYLTRAVADTLYAPLSVETPVDYAASFTPNTNTAINQIVTCTGDTTVQPPTGPTDAVLQLGFLASGGARNVTFASGIRTSTGINRGPHPVPAGEALFAALRWSDLISAWSLLAVTTTAT